jgi:tRNA-2-methylthio-N6-dimethylallyladenosine synthase
MVFMGVTVQIENDTVAEGKKKLFIKSYGCQMNVYDAVRMADLMAPHGYSVVDTPKNADLVILNTCHIRDKADEKVFSDLGRFQKEGHEETLYAVGGCVGQAMGEQVMKRSPDVSIVFGPQTYHRLPEFLAKAKVKDGKGRFTKVLDTDFPELEKFDSLPTQKSDGATAFLSIQEGCDKFCTYCVVPYTRGAEISRSVASVVQDASNLVEQGVKEITLLGQNVNAYNGPDALGNNSTLAKLIQELALIDGLERIRFTTSHPANIDDDLLELFGTEPKLMPYLHLPVQAGSDKILKAMNRSHTAASYIETIKKVRAIRPDIAISGDFIVGFPGETEEDYMKTLAVAAEVGYATAYSFAYSPRPGTPAAALENQVDEVTKKERLAGLQALLESQQEDFSQQFVGKEVKVLVTGKGKKKNQLRGHSEHNLVVNFDGGSRLMGEVVSVKIDGGFTKSLLGTIV